MLLRWPVRTISFNHTGDLIASASEDMFIDIVSYIHAIFYNYFLTNTSFVCYSSINTLCFEKMTLEVCYFNETVKSSNWTNSASDSL